MLSESNPLIVLCTYENKRLTITINSNVLSNMVFIYIYRRMPISQVCYMQPIFVSVIYVHQKVLISKNVVNSNYLTSLTSLLYCYSVWYLMKHLFYNENQFITINLCNIEIFCKIYEILCNTEFGLSIMGGGELPKYVN